MKSAKELRLLLKDVVDEHDVDQIHAALYGIDYLEIDVPCLVPTPGED